jgi:hypothetical protein
VSQTDEEKLLDHLDEVNDVVAEYLKGNNETRISKELSIPRVRVVSYLTEWRGMIAGNTRLRERAREALGSADDHYSKLINKTYEVMDDADNMSNGLKEKTAAIRLIADMEAKRIDMLQKIRMMVNQDLPEPLLVT